MSEKLKKPNEELKEKLPSEIYAMFAGFFPNTRYFDAKFDYLQVQF